MPLYEHVFIARQDISTAQVESLAGQLAEVVKEQGGAVQKTEHWGLRTLAYRMKKNRKGHYVLLNLDAPPAAVRELERQERLSEDVLRHLTIRVQELEPGPSIVLRSRSDRDDSPREHREFDRNEGRDRGYGSRRGKEERESLETPSRESADEEEVA